MKTKSIKSSNWARRLKTALGNGTSYQEGIKLAEKLERGEIKGVIITQTDEHLAVGQFEWAIQPFVEFSHEWEYWLDSAPTKKRAMEICKEMGWKVLE